MHLVVHASSLPSAFIEGCRGRRTFKRLLILSFETQRLNAPTVHRVSPDTAYSDTWTAAAVVYSPPSASLKSLSLSFPFPLRPARSSLASTGVYVRDLRWQIDLLYQPTSTQSESRHFSCQARTALYNLCILSANRPILSRSFWSGPVANKASWRLDIHTGSKSPLPPWRNGRGKLLVVGPGLTTLRSCAGRCAALPQTMTFVCIALGTPLHNFPSAQLVNLVDPE